MKRLLDFDWPKVRLLIGGLPVSLQIDSQVLYLKLFVNFMNINIIIKFHYVEFVLLRVKFIFRALFNIQCIRYFDLKNCVIILIKYWPKVYVNSVECEFQSE